MRDSDVNAEIDRMIESRREKDMGKGLEIDFDTADRFTLLNLKDQRIPLLKGLNYYRVDIFQFV